VTRATKAYTSPRKFGNFQVPIALQSYAIRKYCADRGLVFHLHANENYISDSYLVLETLVESASSYEGIAMCSYFMLPSNSEYRKDIVWRLIDAKCRLHFVFEQLVVGNRSSAQELENLIALVGLTSRRGWSLSADLDTSTTMS